MNVMVGFANNMVLHVGDQELEVRRLAVRDGGSPESVILEGGSPVPGANPTEMITRFSIELPWGSASVSYPASVWGGQDASAPVYT